MNLERILPLFVCQFYSYRITRNLVVPKNTPPKKMRALRPSFLFSGAILKHMSLVHGKIHRYWWNQRLVELPHVHALASWNLLWTVIFLLINLSDGFILLVFVLNLGLDNMFLIFFFLNYMFPIRLGICGLWICSSKSIVFLYKVSFQNIEKSVRRTFSFQLV